MANISDLKSLIDSEPSNAEKSNEEIQAWLNEGSGIFDELLINERGLYAALGPTMAEGILQVLEAVSESNAVVKRALKWLEPSQGGLDLGSVHVRSMVEQLQQGGLLTTEQASALLSMPRERTRTETVDFSSSSLQQIEIARGEV